MKMNMVSDPASSVPLSDGSTVTADASEAEQSCDRVHTTSASSHLITPTTLFRVLLSCIMLLVFAEVFRQVALHGFGHDYIYGFARMIKIGSEKNIPAWFSTVQLFLASMLAFMIFLDRRLSAARCVAHWAGLGFIMLYISMDEAIGLHERTSRPIREALDLGGFLYFSWVVLGFLAVSAVALIYIPFLKSLPKRTARLIFFSGAVYVAGALGMELVGAAIVENGGRYSLAYDVETAIEESLEMVGIAMFIFALSDYASRHCNELSSLFGNSQVQRSK